ncbi:uncharacterized protein DUF1064 [Halanaerobium saccharolyticum]|uniref:Uncharacterized protein DUF1064 n=1 Tax=Halanaerobium saccharolyticum TaxID=43595 RepID=A0A4R6LUH2_9FIRM|nr:DUF1064 domain-containing protein [Halanaerobium saccharolyticum]TDO92331.1 uncharacterized protein DUF1064 [Halanaerobium saccharolyticum]
MTRVFINSEEDAKKMGIPKGEWELIKMERKEQNKSTRKNKYNNKKPLVDGIKFDSKKEARFYENLKLLKAAGEVKEFELQPKFVLLEKNKDRVTGRGIKYIADFKITYSDGSVEVVDVKGHKTQVYKLKKKLLLAKYPDINFREVVNV